MRWLSKIHCKWSSKSGHCLKIKFMQESFFLVHHLQTYYFVCVVVIVCARVCVCFPNTSRRCALVNRSARGFSVTRLERSFGLDTALVVYAVIIHASAFSAMSQRPSQLRRLFLVNIPLFLTTTTFYKRNKCHGFRAMHLKEIKSNQLKARISRQWFTQNVSKS